MFKNKVYLSIGSNIGDKESNIASSIAMLGSYIEISKIRSSSFYKTDSNLNNKKLTKFYDYIARKHYCGNFVADVSTIKLSLIHI